MAFWEILLRVPFHPEWMAATAPCRIVQKDRDAVGGAHAYGTVGNVGDEGVIALEFIPREVGPVHYGYPGAVHLMGADDRIRHYGVPHCGERFCTMSKVVSYESVCGFAQHFFHPRHGIPDVALE